MSKQDDQFLPEQVDEQIETLARSGNKSSLPDARLTSDLQQIYEEEHEIAERVWTRLNERITQNNWGRTRHNYSKDQALHTLMKEARPMKTDATERPPEKNRSHILETLATILVVVILVGGMVLLFQLRQPHQSSLTGSHGMSFATQTPAATAQTPASAAQTPAATASGTPQAPTSVMLSVSASGLAPTTRSEITIPSGTTVTLTVLPDHSLLPFQTFTMGIYATDPYGFSELQYCTYPKTDTCSYTIAYSSSEQTDYTKGKHTFKAFLGNIGGAIEENSAGITITWS